MLARMGNGETGPAWERLESQLGWYEDKSRHHKRWYQGLKVAQIVIAAAIPVVAAAGASATVAGALGAVIVILEGLQQLFRFQENWIAYRVTAEALKREQSVFRARAGVYADAERPEVELAERVERIVSQESGAWAESQRATGSARGGDDANAGE
jgi:Protein of unknown function (DUF4231)